LFDTFAYVRLDVGRQLDELRACARSHRRQVSTRTLLTKVTTVTIQAISSTYA
jgi:hypothetical protein